MNAGIESGGPFKWRDAEDSMACIITDGLCESPLVPMLTKFSHLIGGGYVDSKSQHNAYT